MLLHAGDVKLLQTPPHFSQDFDIGGDKQLVDPFEEESGSYLAELQVDRTKIQDNNELFVRKILKTSPYDFQFSVFQSNSNLADLTK